MSGIVTGWALRNGPADRGMLLVLVVLADAAQNDGTGISLSLTDIGNLAQMSRSMAGERVNQLISGGWVERLWVGAAGRPSRYRIVLPQRVSNRRVVRSGPDDVVRSGSDVSSGLGRTTSSGLGRTSKRNTGSYGSNGRGNGNGPDAPSRSLSPAELRAIADCSICRDDKGLVEIEVGVFDWCDHSASASREVADEF